MAVCVATGEVLVTDYHNYRVAFGGWLRLPRGVWHWRRGIGAGAIQLPVWDRHNAQRQRVGGRLQQPPFMCVSMI